MATIVKTPRESYGATTIGAVELTGADTLGVKTGTLYVFNTSVSPATLVIDGASATTANTKNAGTVDVSGGFSLAVGAGELVAQPLGEISAFLSGATSVTGGTADMFAWVG